MVWLFTCSSAAWLSDRAVWSHTWSRWCWRAGSWMVGLFIVLILVSLHWRSPSALTSFSRVNEPTFNLQISHSLPLLIFTSFSCHCSFSLPIHLTGLWATVGVSLLAQLPQQVQMLWVTDPQPSFQDFRLDSIFINNRSHTGHLCHSDLQEQETVCHYVKFCVNEFWFD